MLPDLATAYPFAAPLSLAIFVAANLGRLFVGQILENVPNAVELDRDDNSVYRHVCDGMILFSFGLGFPFLIDATAILVPAFLLVLAVTILHVRRGINLLRSAPCLELTWRRPSMADVAIAFETAMAALFTTAGPIGLLIWIFFELH